MNSVTEQREKALSICDVFLSFEGVHAISNVSFQVDEGEVFSLIGPNGAGKSSMLNVINGIYVPDRGEVFFHGELLNRKKSKDIARMGIARTFQHVSLFKGMSTLDNIMTGCNLLAKSTFLEQALYFGRPRKEEAEIRLIAEKTIEFLRLQPVRHEIAGDLPYGMQKRIELAKALTSSPKLLLLDEPMAGMNTEEKLEISYFVKHINQDLGISIVLIEHDMGIVMDISSRIVVMNYGKKIAEGPPRQIKGDPEVIKAYLGSSQ